MAVLAVDGARARHPPRYQKVDANVACQQQYGASVRAHYRDYSEPFVLVLLHPVI